MVIFDQQGVPHAGHQLFRIDRLRQEIGCTQLQCLAFELPAFGAGEYEHGHQTEFFVLANCLEDVQPRNTGHHNIQDQDIGQASANRRNRLCRIGNRHKILEARGRKVGLDHFDVHRDVVDDHYCGGAIRGRVRWRKCAGDPEGRGEMVLDYHAVCHLWMICGAFTCKPREMHELGNDVAG